jgi:hypothetical protein
MPLPDQARRRSPRSNENCLMATARSVTGSRSAHLTAATSDCPISYAVVLPEAGAVTCRYRKDQCSSPRLSRRHPQILPLLAPTERLMPAPVTLRPPCAAPTRTAASRATGPRIETKLIQSQRLVLKGETLTEAGALMSSPQRRSTAWRR